MVAYKVTQEQLAALEKLQITDSDLDVLRVACRDADMQVEAWYVLVWAAQRLAVFERYQRSEIKTGKGRIKSIEAVEKAAKALKEAMNDLSGGDYMEMDWRLARVDFPRMTDPKSLCDRSAAVHELANLVSVASRQTLDELSSEGLKATGRTKTLGAYAGHITVIAHQLRPFNLTPGDNGNFRWLCDAVFKIAKVHANSQGAIQHFSKNQRLKMKDEGLCL